MKDKPLVSIIIPNYNYEKTIKVCLDSVIRQTYKNIEIVFVDDGSTDKSVEIASKYPCKIIKSKINKGASAVRNLGADNSSGDILFFLDSDVALFEDAIENTVIAFKNDDSLGSVCGIYAKEPLYNDSLVEEYRILQGHYWRISSEGYVTPAFVSLGAIRRDVFYEIGKFNEKIEGASVEDLEIGFRINVNYKLLLTTKVQGYHDDEYKLGLLCKKIFERARLRIPFYAQRKKMSKGFETPSRAMGMMFAGFSTVLLPASFLSIYFIFLAIASIFLFILFDIGQYIFVFKEKGLSFLLYFIGVHWVVTVVSFYGLVKGVMEFCLSKKFRNRYKLLDT